MIDYDLSIGTYPGILLGLRTYRTEVPTFDDKGKTTDTIVVRNDHVLYIPFVDLRYTTYIEK